MIPGGVILCSDDGITAVEQLPHGRDGGHVEAGHGLREQELFRRKRIETEQGEGVSCSGDS